MATRKLLFKKDPDPSPVEEPPAEIPQEAEAPVVEAPKILVDEMHNTEEIQLLMDRLKAELGEMNDTIIAHHQNGDHELGDRLRMKRYVKQRDYDRLVHRKGMIERA